MHKNILDKFDAAGVEIMSPHYYALRDGNASTVPNVRQIALMYRRYFASVMCRAEMQQNNQQHVLYEAIAKLAES